MGYVSADRFFMARQAAVFSVIFFVLRCSSALCAPQANPAVPKEPVYGDSEGYAVLSFLLEKATTKAKLSSIDILAVTASKEEWLNTEKCLKVPEEFQSAAKDFGERSKSRMRLTDKFSIKVEHALTEGPDVRPAPAAPGEQQLEESFVGKVFFTVSAVGFDQTKTHAIAYVSAYCGVMCASGAYHLLTKDKQGWKETQGSPRCEWMAQDRGSILNLLGRGDKDMDTYSRLL